MKKVIFGYLTLVVMSSICLSANAMKFSSPNHEFMDSFHWTNEKGDLLRVYATREIDENSGEMLERFVKQNKIPKAIIFFNSGGGSLSGAIGLGKVIRQLAGC